MSKCPHCQKDFQHVNLQSCDLRFAMQSWVGVSYNCPHCNCSLSVSVDHIAFGNEIAGKVIAQLRNER